MLTIYSIIIHDKPGVEIYKLNSISKNEHCYRGERRALKEKSLSALTIIELDEHNTKRILNSSW